MRTAAVALGAIVALTASAAQAQDDLINEYTGPSPGAWNVGAHWSLGSTPLPTQVVSIPPAKTVLLPNNLPIAVKAISIEGTLTAPQGALLKIRTSRIDVHHMGAFLVGTQAAPFTGELEVLLTLDPSSPTTSKQIMVHEGGTLKLFGDTGRRSWLRLRDISTMIPGLEWQGAHAGTLNNFLYLDGTTGWRVSDALAISSTDFDMHQAEPATVAATAPFAGGDLIQTAQGLAYRHYSREFQTGKLVGGVPLEVDMRASVACLTRNIRIQGDTDSTKRWGGDIMIHSSLTHPSAVHLSHVEFAQMGQYGHLGHYPVHFHMCGDSLLEAVVSGCSFHHCYHRAVTIHRTNGVSVIDNCAYDIYGHAYFLEDGNEIGNTLTGNLGFLIRTPNVAVDALNHERTLGQTMFWGNAGTSYAETITGSTYTFFRYHDMNPAVFWISNMANIVTDNVAAGSDAYGFTFDHTALGYNNAGQTPLQSQNYFFTTLGQSGTWHQKLSDQQASSYRFQFARNTAHSCGRVGFFADEDAVGRARPYTTDSGSHQHYTPHFDDNTAFKCRRAGLWYRQYGESIWRRLRVSDNALGIYVASAGFTEDFPFWPFRTLLGGVAGADVTKQWQGAAGVGPRAPAMVHHLIIDSVVVGETSNTGHDPVTGAGSLDWEPGAGRSLPFFRSNMPRFTTVSGVTPRLDILTQHFSNQDVGRSAMRLWLRGFELYDGVNGLAGTHFQDFRRLTINTPNGPIVREVTAISANNVGESSWTLGNGFGNPWPIDPRNYSTGLTTSNIDELMFVPSPRAPRLLRTSNSHPELGWVYGNALHDMVMHDLDGSMSQSAQPTYVFPPAATLLKSNGPFDPVNNPTGFRTVGNLHFMPVASNPIAYVQFEMPVDWNVATPTTSHFRNLRVSPANNPTLTRMLFDPDWSANVDDRGGYGNQILRATNQRLKRIFGCNLTVMTDDAVNQNNEYFVAFERANGSTTHAPEAYEYAVRLRFGVAGGNVVLRLLDARKPVAVEVVTPPSDSPPSGAFFPTGDIFAAPSTTRLFVAAPPLQASTSLANVRSATTDTWAHIPGATPAQDELVLKLVMPARPTGGGNDGVFTGGERILRIRY
ncbi:MAG: G8 domain-containing protein [Planctomycetes bacterium]|nr:G8 domain-containing protein [Planctomycetota bacterium]